MPDNKKGMVSLKTTRKEMDAPMIDGSPVNEDEDIFPWGTEITLRDDVIEKLGLDVSKVKVGSEVGVYAFGKVTTVAQPAAGGDNKRIEIQLTDIRIEGLKENQVGVVKNSNRRFEEMPE